MVRVHRIGRVGVASVFALSIAAFQATAQEQPGYRDVRQRGDDGSAGKGRPRFSNEELYREGQRRVKNEVLSKFQGPPAEKVLIESLSRVPLAREWAAKHRKGEMPGTTFKTYFKNLVLNEKPDPARARAWRTALAGILDGLLAVRDSGVGPEARAASERFQELRAELNKDWTFHGPGPNRQRNELLAKELADRLEATRQKWVSESPRGKTSPEWMKELAGRQAAVKLAMMEPVREGDPVLRDGLYMVEGRYHRFRTSFADSRLERHPWVPDFVRTPDAGGHVDAGDLAGISEARLAAGMATLRVWVDGIPRLEEYLLAAESATLASGDPMAAGIYEADRKIADTARELQEGVAAADLRGAASAADALRAGLTETRQALERLESFKGDVSSTDQGLRQAASKARSLGKLVDRLQGVVDRWQARKAEFLTLLYGGRPGAEWPANLEREIQIRLLLDAGKSGQDGYLARKLQMMAALDSLRELGRELELGVAELETGRSELAGQMSELRGQVKTLDVRRRWIEFQRDSQYPELRAGGVDAWLAQEARIDITLATTALSRVLSEAFVRSGGKLRKLAVGAQRDALSLEIEVAGLEPAELVCRLRIPAVSDSDGGQAVDLQLTSGRIGTRKLSAALLSQLVTLFQALVAPGEKPLLAVRAHDFGSEAQVVRLMLAPALVARLGLPGVRLLHVAVLAGSEVRVAGTIPTNAVADLCERLLSPAEKRAGGTGEEARTIPNHLPVGPIPPYAGPADSRTGSSNVQSLPDFGAGEAGGAVRVRVSPWIFNGLAEGLLRAVRKQPGDHALAVLRAIDRAVLLAYRDGHLTIDIAGDLRNLPKGHPRTREIRQIAKKATSFFAGIVEEERLREKLKKGATTFVKVITLGALSIHYEPKNFGVPEGDFHVIADLRPSIASGRANELILDIQSFSVMDRVDGINNMAFCLEQLRKMGAALPAFGVALVDWLEAAAVEAADRLGIPRPPLGGISLERVLEMFLSAQLSSLVSGIGKGVLYAPELGVDIRTFGVEFKGWRRWLLDLKPAAAKVPVRVVSFERMKVEQDWIELSGTLR